MEADNGKKGEVHEAYGRETKTKRTHTNEDNIQRTINGNNKYTVHGNPICTADMSRQKDRDGSTDNFLDIGRNAYDIDEKLLKIM